MQAGTENDFSKVETGQRGLKLPARKVYRSIRKITAIALQTARNSQRLLHNSFDRLVRRSDYTRWSGLENYEVWWDARTEKIAQLVDPHSKVIEFGAGRRTLERLLPPYCTYIPSDLEDRGPNTFVCDLNRRPLPDLSGLEVDTAVFGGVLEYIHDLESLVSWISRYVRVCIVSYTCRSRVQSGVARVRNHAARLYYGYMNNYSEDEFSDVFSRSGFVCSTTDTWNEQRLFRFERRDAKAEMLVK